MLTGEEYSYRGTNFIIECKEHINRVASPGSRNYIIRGLLSYGEEVELPESVDGDPVTSFMPSLSFAERIVYPGVKRLLLPGHLGRFIERNDLFPDLEELEVDPANRIFSTDGKMLYRDGGKELCLSLAAGSNERTVTVPEGVQRLGPYAFADSRCEEIIFENPWIEAEENSFDRSEWLERQGQVAYVGNMLYRIRANEAGGRLSIMLKEGIERVNKSAFADIGKGGSIKLCIPVNARVPGLADAVISSLRSADTGGVQKDTTFITLSRKDGSELEEKEIPVPLSLDSEGIDLLCKTIDDGTDHYDDIFDKIIGWKDRLDYALFIAAGQGDIRDDLYGQIIGSNQEEAVRRAAELLDEVSICRLLKRGYIGSGGLLKMIPDLQRRGMINAVTSILRNCNVL